MQPVNKLKNFVSESTNNTKENDLTRLKINNNNSDLINMEKSVSKETIEFVKEKEIESKSSLTQNSIK